MTNEDEDDEVAVAVDLPEEIPSTAPGMGTTAVEKGPQTDEILQLLGFQ